MKRISKHIDVDIKVYDNGAVDFYFTEPESGDSYRICAHESTLSDEERRVGSELLSWVSLMQDELDDMEDESCE